MESETKPPLQERLWRVTAFSDLNIIGQFHNTYILGEVDDRLVAVDQHAAHERILFERLQKKTTGTPIPVQGLLVPEIIDLGYREAAVLKPMLSDLQNAGLEIEPFGGNSFAVKAVPAFLAGQEIRPLIVELVEKAVVTGVSGRLEAVREQCLTVIACHGAIRANQALDHRQMEGLLEELDACNDPAHCPHGRPTWIEWRLSEVEKRFGRT